MKSASQGSCRQVDAGYLPLGIEQIMRDGIFDQVRQ
jgi:hypothetical protein